ncbi:hypothetical protein GCM10027175_31980 [Hymenobacter latericoloratus]
MVHGNVDVGIKEGSLQSFASLKQKQALASEEGQPADEVKKVARHCKRVLSPEYATDEISTVQLSEYSQL